MPGAGRYAPSPSGDLHLGNLRTALLAWLCARSTQRNFLMRVEDLDRSRDAGAAQSQLQDLAAIGIDWDGEVLFQTSRIELYSNVLSELKNQGLTYECFCSRKDILQAVSAPHAPPGSYPGTCRHLNSREIEEARQHISPRRPATRIKLPAGVTNKTFVDELYGEVTAEVDDFVLLRGDGTYAYNFVVVVDDGATGVDQVVRGSDLLTSSARQIALQELLHIPRPEYVHVPLVLGSSKERLAKRDGGVTLRQLQERGVGLEEIIALLLEQSGQTSLDPAEFDLASVPRDPWVWDASAL